ncbi:ABC transporter ATP-binding protein [Chitinophaga sancti]|uniref:ABC transporter ATP-binding protein n=1 Tax=Chitinophaga sancti TaxID=1004 RepID=A0A1K1RHK7_9BACT|nr:ABC transporter ATP-binding protein [Chitinophaga sancti]MBP1653334.1 transporter related [Bacteroidota bacterium]WQD60656.1 ABC transporter ATP-binding protein [Chitinophaga sancti]WQG87216.1 ABC transporter ATP-binding protein [Chitinophaga sancti]SFW71746.1 ABC-type lipoprotein export system, ATPase component [Chitinophaga sancti]
MIQLKHISKYYPVGFGKNEILKDIDLTIFEGEFVSIMGPSGSGKSTLLHILGLLEEPSQGEYLFEGEPVHKMNEKKRTQLHRGSIGFVFQAYHLIDELTVYENIETPLLYKNIPSAERKSRVADVLDRFNIVAKKDLFPNQLSGGQQQLVGIARAIVAEPRVILADEPTGNLHSDQAKEIMELFKQLNQRDKITIIQVTHSELNATYGQRIIQIRDGKIA